MKKLQVYGTGCAKCHQLAEATQEAAQAAGVEYELEKVTGIDDIVAAGVMVTPALAVDGEVKVSGRVPSLDELQSMLAQ